MNPAATPRSSVLSSIAAQLHRYTVSEQRVARCLLEEVNRIDIITVQGLALKASVSEATVVRFSRTLGYRGFADFKRSLLEELMIQSQERIAPYGVIDPHDSALVVAEKLFALMRAALDVTASALASGDFIPVVELIEASPRLELFGYGGSGYIVENAALKFVLLGVLCSSHVDPFTMENFAAGSAHGNVALFVSGSGYTAPVITACNAARRAGATTVAITADRHSPLARSAQFCLPTELPEVQVGSDTGANRIAQVALLDAIAVTVAHRKYAREVGTVTPATVHLKGHS